MCANSGERGLESNDLVTRPQSHGLVIRALRAEFMKLDGIRKAFFITPHAFNIHMIDADEIRGSLLLNMVECRRDELCVGDASTAIGSQQLGWCCTTKIYFEER